MKAEILRILQMQRDGKLTQDQAAELLAILADQAREKEGNPTPASTATGAPGPQGDSSECCGNNNKGAGSTGGGGASAALHSLVDTAVGIGTTVGHAATVWGGELIHMVHRDQGGNNVTLSKVEDPSGDGFTFRGNTINVSKVSRLTLRQAEFVNNSINASQVGHVAITGGRFNQCRVTGSSISHITIEGAVENSEAAAGATVEGEGSGVVGGIRGVTFNATKFLRVRLLAGSLLDAGAFQASSIKDLELSQQSVVRDSRIVDSSMTAMRLERASLLGVAFERSNVQGLIVRNSILDRIIVNASRVADTTIEGSTLANTRFRRDALNAGNGGKESILQESMFEHCVLTNCDFAGCTFRRTTLRNITLTGAIVRNVDFTGMTLESDEAFKKAAGI